MAEQQSPSPMKIDAVAVVWNSGEDLCPGTFEIVSTAQYPPPPGGERLRS